MGRKGWWVAALALVLVAPVAHAAGGWTIGVTGGMGIPTGNFASDDSTTGLEAKSGPTVGLDISYRLTDMFDIGVDGGWTSNKHANEGKVEDLGAGETITAEKDRFVSFHFGAHVKAKLPMGESKVKPYGLLGLGIYNVEEDYEYVYDDGMGFQIVFTDETDGIEQPGARLGGRVGAGAMYQATKQIGVGLEADFNYITMDKDKFGLSSLQYATVRAVLSFGISTP
jgi:hypothetical protein